MYLELLYLRIFLLFNEEFSIRIFNITMIAAYDIFVVLLDINAGLEMSEDCLFASNWFLSVLGLTCCYLNK